MVRLINRQTQIPFGFKFAIPAVQWRSRNYSSFDQIVKGAIVALQGNPHIANKLGWDLSYDAMAQRVDEYNSLICEKMGWNDFIEGGSGGAGRTVPFHLNQPNLQPGRINAAGGGNTRPGTIRYPPNRPDEPPKMSGSVEKAVLTVKKLAAGGATLLEWDEAGMPHVYQETADARAKTCSGCPKNNTGQNLSDIFTVPLASLIRKRFEKMAEMKIATPYDDKLNVCDACLCPMRTKVWFPDELVLKRMKPEWKADLQQVNPRCWILDIADARKT